MSHERPTSGLLLALAVILASRLAQSGFLENTIVELLLLAVIPVLFIKLCGRNLKDFGLSAGNLKLGLKYSIVIFTLALPVMFYGSRMSEFKDYYPLWKPAYGSFYNLILYELAVGVLLLSTEVFYRGFLLFTLNEKTKYGNLLHACVYALAHTGKPFLEIPYSFFAGLVFGHVDLKCKSILPSFLMHFLGNIAFDLMLIHLL
jgi:membrane protease YdiL (CAAX protease family)